MKIVSFNVENLFERAKALNSSEWVNMPGDDPSRWSPGQTALDAFAKLNALLQKPVYTGADKAEILAAMRTLGIERRDEGPLVWLRRNRGALVVRHRDGTVEVIANGRGDWIGWLELKSEPIDEIAILNTARVIKDVDADIVVVVEAESRPALKHFNRQLLKAVGGRRYDHIMLIDGNDERGIDVGLMTRASFPVGSMRSHVDDMDGGEEVFSRDCPEYSITLPTGETLIVLANHFKSKVGDQAKADAKRLLQAQNVRAIYKRLRDQGHTLVVVAGDLNDTPTSAPLSPLMDTDLCDISAHPSFQFDGHPGTFANGSPSEKIDYLLLSPALFDRVTAGGVWRKGVWGNKDGKRWPIYPEITKPSEAASDHAAIWAEFA